MPFSITELFFGKQDQNSVQTSINFSTLKSFSVNDTNVAVNTTPPNIISLNSSLNEFDQCILKYTPLNDKTSAIISHSTKKPSLYKTYSSVEKLQYNQVYKFTVNINGQSVSLSFVSKCNPYYSNIKKIREDCGDFIDELEDQTINFFIYQNSKELVEKIRNNFTAMVNYNGSIPQVSFSLLNMLTAKTGTFLPSQMIPPFVKNWVRYKTDIDLLNRIYLTLVGENGATKTLGPLTIQNKGRVPAMRSLIKRFQDLYNDADAYLSSPPVAATTKAKNVQYPLNPRVF